MATVTTSATVGRPPVVAALRGRVNGRVAAIALAAVGVRAGFVTMPLRPDEGGFLMIAAQWRPGSSLYGDYWVDRPPLLLDVFSLADAWGGGIALRVIGLALVAASVLLAGRVGRLSGGSPAASALTAAIFLSTPLFGTLEINGEMIATPAVLGTLALTLSASRAGRHRRAVLAAALAGALAAAALLIKQNELDGVVFLVAAAATFKGRHSGRRRVILLATAAGGLVTTSVVVAAAAVRGTRPSGLWDALVVFRIDASQVIDSSASSATTDRLHHLLLALLASGAPVLVVLTARRFRRRPRRGAPDLRWATIALLVWESFSALAGGSYWLHYLICLVPGLVLAVSTATARPGSTRDLRAALGLAAVSALVTAGVVLGSPSTWRTEPVVTWLRAHVTAGQTGIVAYGQPDYLEASGLTSPYSELWSLPVRVRDPGLTQLTRVLAGPLRPDWVVTGASGSLSGWGIDSSHAQPVFDSHYRLVADLGDRRIYLAKGERLPDRENS